MVTKREIRILQFALLWIRCMYWVYLIPISALWLPVSHWFAAWFQSLGFWLFVIGPLPHASPAVVIVYHPRVSYSEDLIPCWKGPAIQSSNKYFLSFLSSVKTSRKVASLPGFPPFVGMTQNKSWDAWERGYSGKLKHVQSINTYSPV